ncbi:hypothetical protein CJF30_00011258 [Rutstroemia sp. NJR-2017a BBW]|nr:hypothetical protein CJF30_00011258 [Rutstroemia sp. NJR-2017a BBW]
MEHKRNGEMHSVGVIHRREPIEISDDEENDIMESMEVGDYKVNNIVESEEVSGDEENNDVDSMETGGDGENQRIESIEMEEDEEYEEEFCIDVMIGDSDQEDDGDDDYWMSSEAECSSDGESMDSVEEVVESAESGEHVAPAKAELSKQLKKVDCYDEWVQAWREGYDPCWTRILPEILCRACAEALMLGNGNGVCAHQRGKKKCRGCYLQGCACEELPRKGQMYALMLRDTIAKKDKDIERLMKRGLLRHMKKPKEQAKVKE